MTRAMVHNFVRRLIFAAAILGAAGAAAQTTPASVITEWSLQCEGLGQVRLRPVLEVCAAHAVCKQVLEQRNGCPAKLSFAERLSLAGGQVTGLALWQAALPDAMRSLEARSDWKHIVDLMDQYLHDMPGSAYASGHQAGGSAGFLSHAQGKVHGLVYVFFNDGLMRRGEYKQGLFDGPCDQVTAAGVRYIGQCVQDKSEGIGLLLYPNGWTAHGHFRQGFFAEGKRFRPDGTLDAQGRFAPGTRLVQGERYDASGVSRIAVVNALAEVEPVVQSASEQSCREKLRVYNLEQADKVSRLPASDLLGLTRRVMHSAKARMDWLRSACSDWNLHLRLVWDAQDALDTAQDYCQILTGQTCKLDPER